MTIGIELEKLMRARRLPVQGVKIGVTTDKSTWEVDWRGFPEQAEADEAQNIIDAYAVPEIDLEILRSQTLVSIDQRMEKENRHNFFFEGRPYSLALEKQLVLVATYLLAHRILRGQSTRIWPSSFAYEDHSRGDRQSGEMIPFTAEKFLELGDAATLLLSLRQQHAAGLKKAVEAANDHAAIRAVDLDTGWP